MMMIFARMATISLTHKAWVELMLEIFNQQENDNGDIDIVNGCMKKLQKKGAAAEYILPTGHVPDTPYFFLHQLCSPTKWPQAQQHLSDYFVKNPTSTHAPPPRQVLANDSSSKDDKGKGESSNHQRPVLPAVSKQDSRLPPPHCG